MTQKAMKVKKTIVNTITYVFFIAMVIGVVLALIFSSSGRILFLGKYTMMWVKTDSMEDTIPARSYIWVEKISADDVKLNDVIVFYSDDPQIAGQLNTHRVVGISEDRSEFTTCGDHNLGVVDKYPVRSECIVARYVRNVPVLTYFGRLMETPVGIMIVSMLLFAVIIFVYVPDMIKTVKEQQQKQEEEEKKRFQELVDAEVARLKENDEQKNQK